MAPVSPFFSDWLYRSLTAPASAGITDSVHLSNFPVSQPQYIDSELEETMQVAQDLCSMVLSIRKKEKIRVRQPLSRIMVPIANEQFRQRLKHVESLILSEVNVKELHYLEEDNEVLVKTLRLNFKALGPRAGAQMKAIQEKAKHLTQADIRKLEQEGKIALQLADGDFELMLGETEILAQDIPGWQVAVNGNLTVALDITLNDALLSEGRARDLVNRIQNMRKDQGFQVTDRIRIEWQAVEAFAAVIAAHADYICAEVLAEEILQCDDPALDFFDIDGLRVGLRLALAPSPATN
jgi:isoleucyl-tRNA synthetase